MGLCGVLGLLVEGNETGGVLEFAAKVRAESKGEDKGAALAAKLRRVQEGGVREGAAGHVLSRAKGHAEGWVWESAVKRGAIGSVEDGDGDWRRLCARPVWTLRLA